MQRVLFLCEGLCASNGWGMYSVSLIHSLRKKGIDVSVLSSDKEGDGVAILPRLHSGRIFWFIGLIRIWFFLKTRKKFDLIHVGVEHYARLYRAFGRTPFVITVHGTYADPLMQGDSWAVRMYTGAMEHASGIIAVSEYTKKRVPDRFKEKVNVIHNAVDISIKDEPFSSIKKIGDPCILSVGALKPRKGFEYLIHGFSFYLKKHPFAHLTIIGDDQLSSNYVSELNELVSNLNIQSAVSFLGKVSRKELLGWYRACDFFALTSVDKGGVEGYGLVFLEANVFGKPSLGSIESGAEAAIRPGVSGVLVSPKYPKSVFDGLERLSGLKKEEILDYVSKQSWDESADKYFQLYRSLVS